jgi:fatty-acyl-CoA synthase
VNLPTRAGGLDELWCARLARDSAAPALHCGSVAFSRANFEAEIRSQQAALGSAGVGPGDIVAWLGINTPQMLASLFACERIGAVFLPLNLRLAEEELRAIVAHAGARIVRGSADLHAQIARLNAGLEPDLSTDAGDLLLVYTSGTTGRAKGAVHTAVQMRANAEAAIAVQGLDRGTRTLATLPLFHVGGLCIQTLPTLLAGGLLRLQPRFDAHSWFGDVAQWRPTTTLLVPATMQALVSHPLWVRADLSSLRFVNSGSSVVPLALIEVFHARGVPVAQVYGSTETGPVSIALDPAQALAHPGKVGRAAPGVTIRLAGADGSDVSPGEVGEILVRGANVMRGYHREPDHPSFRDGWFHSGDLARVDRGGFYEVVGRSKDMIVSGGENIYPAEIENLVAVVPGVAECAVVGCPDTRWGEVPVLVVVAQPGARVEPDVLRAAFASRLARFKHPHRIVMLDSLPKTALGKVQKSALAERLAAG